ncbi:MAG TPA: amylo-alpha-1,6-glucosidase [Kofleriaceae bacterium]|jgi:predicted glycogen debranching enzyme|nr:amylo-alpha-1,6-glucosidase [Kofleriaceae bacterium]
MTAALPADDPVVRREWLVCNGLGGYASGTIGGAPTRRYHGYLIAALPNPAGRVMMLNALLEQVRLHDGTRVDLGWDGPAFASGPRDERHDGRIPLVDFRTELGLPIWRYAGHGAVIERRIVLSYSQNTAVVVYRLLDGPPIRLELRPALQFRGHDEPVSTAIPEAYPLHAFGARIELTAPAPLPPLKLHLAGERTSFVIEPRAVPDIAYVTEESRGYASRGRLYSPGRFRAHLAPGGEVALIASTEPWDTILTIGAPEALATETERRFRLLDAAPPAARRGPAAELVLAADAFVIRPAGRHEDHIRARIAGDEAWTVIAGYHWFTDWGRDTMISLEGLTLATGRSAEAGSILRMFAHHLRDGLVPNMFPEGASEGLYHTADATLWFFHAIDRYVRASDDHRTLAHLLPALVDIINHHMAGTRFGIRVDPADGLLGQGAEGYQLTWMDAKVGDWVVTPRRGKAVEINALWYNALRLMQAWLDDTGDRPGAARMRHAAERAHAAFNQRFWSPERGHLYDVVDGEHGDDPACRPNQLFAISLPHPVLDPAHWQPVLETVERELVTPFGLRSLSPRHPDYKPSYRGDLVTRDAAYHQGTVWSWLIGPYVDAVLRVRGDAVSARRALDGLISHLRENCIGYVSEVFDAEPPFTPGGCVAQAWGIAEVLRCLLRTER